MTYATHKCTRMRWKTHLNGRQESDCEVHRTRRHHIYRPGGGKLDICDLGDVLLDDPVIPHPRVRHAVYPDDPLPSQDRLQHPFLQHPPESWWNEMTHRLCPKLRPRGAQDRATNGRVLPCTEVRRPYGQRNGGGKKRLSRAQASNNCYKGEKMQQLPGKQHYDRGYRACVPLAKEVGRMKAKSQCSDGAKGAAKRRYYVGAQP